MWHTQEVLFTTEHFGKEYVWMKDIDGHVYMTRLDEEGQPILW